MDITFIDTITREGVQFLVTVSATSGDPETGAGVTYQIDALTTVPGMVDLWPFIQSLGECAEANVRADVDEQINWQAYGL